MWKLLFCWQLISTVLAQSTTDAQNATTFSLLYGYPLLAWQSYYTAIVEAAGVNTWHHSRELNTAANRTVVKPNVDTLYSQVVFDLSQSNVEITIPEVPAYNFKLFSFYDPYGDNFANVGTDGFYEPGTYLIQPYYTPGGNHTTGLQVGGGSNGYVAIVSSPTAYGTLLVRWGLNQTNIDAVHRWQNKCEIKTVAPSKDVAAVSPPPLKSLISVYKESADPAVNVLNLLGVFAPPNGPNAVFRTAGISNGTYTSQSSVNLTQANTTALFLAAEGASDPNNLEPVNHGWLLLNPDVIGTYGTDYAVRTAIGLTGYLALRGPFAIYPTWSNGSDVSATSELDIASDEALLFTFSGKPPLDEGGFWSLTVYGGDYYLIPNKLDVYALGDRSNLTYPNGQRVYPTSGGSDKDDGVFQILLQPADVAPPSNWTSNWVPAPAGGGSVVPQLRFYVAKPPLTDGNYEYPIVERISAITSGSSGSSGGNGGGSGGGSGSGSGSSSGSSALAVPLSLALFSVVWCAILM